jgi:hypothetical protein
MRSATGATELVLFSPLPSSARPPAADFREHAARVKNWDSFEPVLSRAEQIDTSDLLRLTEGIPEEWWSRGDSEDLSRLVENLCHRRSSIRDLITAFRNSTRNPFPNWAGN